MEIEFDLEAVKIVEFGVGRDGENERIFVTVPVDDSVQKVLKEMVHATLDRMKKDENGPSEYQPSEKHGALEWLYLPLTNELCLDLRVLHAANNMDMDAGALSSPSDVFCYFARMVDARGRRLTALRRASQFKSVVKKKGWLIRWVDDSLRSVKDDIFKLDADFDFIIDQRNVHIIRPSGFEFAGRLQSAVCASVSRNVAEIQAALPFVDFGCIERYAVGHVRAARYLASIRSQSSIKDINKDALKRLCDETGVVVSEVGERMEIGPGHEVGFLQVLDRRRYTLELVSDRPEKFVASSRKSVG